MDTIRAWKDPEYRKSLDSTILPHHPSGAVSLDDSSLDAVAGGTGTICATIYITVRFCSDGGTCGYFSTGCC